MENLDLSEMHTHFCAQVLLHRGNRNEVSMNKERSVLPTQRIRFLVPMCLLKNLQSVWKVNTHLRIKKLVSLMKKWLKSGAMNVYICWSYLYICLGCLWRGRSLWLAATFELTVSHASGRSTDSHTMSTMANVCDSSTNEEITFAHV